MFSLHDIDNQIAVFNAAADDLEAKADATPHQGMDMCLRGAAHGLRDAARSLQRMVERHIETEAREAMQP